MQWHGFSSLLTLNAYKELIPLHNDLRELERYLRELEVRLAKISGDGEPIASDPVGNPTGRVTQHARTHATVTSENTTAQGGGTDLITPYPFTWFRPHTFAINTSDDTPIKITLASGATADALQVEAYNGRRIFTVDHVNAVGINEDDPTAHLVVQATGFDPSTLSPDFWYRPDSGPTGIDATDVSGGLVDGGTMLTWFDQTSNDRDLTFVGTVCQYKTNLQNGYAGVQFSSSSGHYAALSPAKYMTPSGAYTLFVVSKVNGATFANFTLLSNGTPDNIVVTCIQAPVSSNPGAGDTATTWRVRNASSGSTFSIADEGGGGVGLGSWSPGIFNVHTVKRVATGSAMSARLNGTSVTGTPVTVTGTPTWAYIGFSPAGGQRQEQILEVIGWLSELSTANILQVEAYLNAKYNLNGGGTGGTALNYVQTWQDTNGAIQAQVDSGFKFGLNTTPSTRLHVLDTSEQVRVSYDTSNDLRLTVGSTGLATFNSTGAAAGAAFADSFLWTNTIAPTLAANTDNWAPTDIATATNIRVTASSAVDLTGITTGVAGRLLHIFNVGTNAITLKDDVTSTAANRFQLNGDIILGASQGVTLIYDGTDSRWRVSGMNAAGGGVVGGTGTTNRVARWTSATNIGDANIIDDGATITMNLPIDMVTNRIKNLGSPVDPDDAISDAWLTDTTHEFNVEQRFAANPGITVTQGVIRSEVPDLVGNYIYNFTPATTLTSGTDRWYFSLKTSGGTRLFSCRADTCFDFGSSVVSGGFLNIGGTLNISGIYAGFYFNPIIQSTGSGFSGITGNAIVAGNFLGRDNATGTNTSIIGGRFIADSSSVGKAYNDIVGGVFGISIASVVGFSAARAIGALVGPFTSTGMGQVTDMMGILIKDPTIDAADTTNLYGIQVEEQIGGTSNTRASILLHQANAGYKSLCFRDTTAYINSDAAGDLDLNAINIDINGNLQRGWVSVNSHSSFY